jgi:ribosomal protein L11 methyltransferase
MRSYPALDVTWPIRPDHDHIERLLAAIDDDAPVAIEERDGGLRIFFQTATLRGRAAARVIAIDAWATCAPCEVPDEDWAARSQSQIAAVRVGAIVVAPPWDVPGDRRGVIVINPGMGFGTGHHPSTRLCLSLLQQEPVAGRTALDMGTGSGVLAIGAWKLGAASVLAVDVDEDALLCARENVELNAAGSTVALGVADLAVPFGAAGPMPVTGTFDIVLANLTGGLLTRHAVQLTARLAPGGRLIVSGLTVDEEAEVTSAFVGTGLDVPDRAGEGEWVGLAFRANPNASTAR